MTFVLKAFVEYPDGTNQTIEFEDKTISIGRVEDNNLCLVHPSISRKHAIITLNDNSIQVQDLGSSNGTRVNNVAITEAVEVKPEQAIYFGDVQVSFALPAEYVKTQMMQAIADPVPEQATQVMSGITNLTELEIIEPGKASNIIILGKEVTSLGRAENSDVWLSDPTVSRDHLHIVREGDNFSFCKQPNCSGSVSLNNRLTDQGMLTPGDELLIGQTKLIFQPNAKEKFQEQKHLKKQKLIYSIAGALTLVVGLMLFQHFYSPERQAESFIAQAEKLYSQNQYFAAIESISQGEQYQSIWTPVQKKRFFTIQSLANLEQGLKLLQANRWKESLLYFESAIESANQDLSIEDTRVRVSLSIFGALSQQLEIMLNQDTVSSADEIFEWMKALYSETNAEDLKVYSRKIGAKKAVADYEHQIQKQFLSKQPEHSVTWLMQCFEDPASTQVECNKFADRHHLKVYSILNQLAVSSRLDKTITAKALNTLLEYANMLANVKPNIAKYQDLAREIEVFHQNVLAKEKLKKELMGDELDLDDFS
jgi:pSer/pThr/pTyr-binding forkhead associated (FHA) protein/tetratricopeptide (TPR) repeat protein